MFNMNILFIKYLTNILTSSFNEIHKLNYDVFPQEEIVLSDIGFILLGVEVCACERCTEKWWRDYEHLKEDSVGRRMVHELVC